MRGGLTVIQVGWCSLNSMDRWQNCPKKATSASIQQPSIPAEMIGSTMQPPSRQTDNLQWDQGWKKSSQVGTGYLKLQGLICHHLSPCRCQRVQLSKEFSEAHCCSPVSSAAKTSWCCYGWQQMWWAPHLWDAYLAVHLCCSAYKAVSTAQKFPLQDVHNKQTTHVCPVSQLPQECELLSLRYKHMTISPLMSKLRAWLQFPHTLVFGHGAAASGHEEVCSLQQISSKRKSLVR